MASGASESAWRPITCAPICLSGVTMRPMGRFLSERSPETMLRKGCAARSPDTSRMVVPLLPALSGAAGSRRPCLPRPRTSKHSGAPDTEQLVWRRIRTPRPRRQRSIDTRSSPTQKLETCAVPSAIEFSSAARCEMDLSPGGTTSPSMPLCRFDALVHWLACMTTRPPFSTSMLRLCPWSRAMPTSGVAFDSWTVICLG